MKRPTRARDLLTAAGILLVGFAFHYTFRQFGWFLQDEGDLYYPYLRTYKGQLPYRDFFTGYPPMIHYLHAFIFRHVEISIPATRTFMALVNSLTPAVLFLVSRRVMTWGFALIPSLFFLVMQPGDITNMVFQNAPYPSWYAIGFIVLTLWAGLRVLESREGVRRGAWLLLVGALAGMTFMSKQNAGIFILWAVSGFLLSSPLPGTRGMEEPRSSEPGALRLLRFSYLALIPIAAAFLIRNYTSPLTLAFFVAPTVALAALGARTRFSKEAWRRVAGHLLLVGMGFLAAFLPWLWYFGRRVGFGHFLGSLFFLGTNVEQNLYVPLPPLHTLTVVLLGPAVLAILLGLGRRLFAGVAETRDRALLSGWTLWLALLGPPVLLLGSLGGGSPFLQDLLAGKLPLGSLYLAFSYVLDNLAAYGSLLLLWAGIALAWRLASRPGAGEGPPRRAFLLILWAAACAYILYFPRMDAAHLFVGATPVLYIVAATLLSRARTRFTRSLAPAKAGRARVAFNALCVVILGAIIVSRTMPKIYSRVSLVRTAQGLTIQPTNVEWLTLPRTGVYFPVYYEAQRKQIVDFRDLVIYIQSRTSESDPIFAFPALSMLYFVSGRDNPTRFDYFFGNNVSFRHQMEVIRTLDEKRVDYVVMFNNPNEYFMLKGRAFTQLIREYIARRYFLERRIGPYDVLRRYADAESPAGAPARTSD